MSVTRTDVAADLRELGLEAGDEVVVHSSLSSIGWVEGGADAVVDALLDVVGDAGTVVVPTFTSGPAQSEPFDPEEMASTTGAVTEALRTRSDARRSGHPTHSVSAVGAAAAEVTADHDYLSALGEGSPLHRLADRGGEVLLIGVDHRRNSTVHVGEALAGLSYKGRTREALVADEDGTPKAVETESPGCSQGFLTFQAAAEEAGVVTRGRVGDADAQLVPGRAIIDVVRDVTADDPGALLCDDEDCSWCTSARRILAETG